MTDRDLIGRLSRRDLLVRSSTAAAGLAAARWIPTSAAPLRQDATPAPTPKKGGTLIFGHLGDVDNYDPLTDALDQFQNYGRLMIYSALTAYDVNLNLIGDLATSWELQGASWVFKLRQGVTWHDGSPFTAADVKYTMERALDPKVGSFASTFVGDKTTVDVVDSLTVKVNLPAVNASYPDLMTAVSMVKKGSGESNKATPVGTGPFKFGSWSPNEQTVYVKNDQYYTPDVPYLGKIVFKPTPDPQVALTNLTAGSVDAISNQLVLPQTAKTLDGQPGIKLVIVDPSTSLAYANVLQKAAPFTDKRFRQGLAMCLDLGAVKDLVYAGRGAPTNNIIPQLSWAYLEIPPYEYNPDKARSLFAAAGVPNGFKTTIDTIEGYPDLIAIAPIWQDGLKKAGLDAKVTTYEINTWLDRWNNGQYQISMNFDINGPDPQRMFVADILLHISNGQITQSDLVKKVQDGSAAAIATADREARKKIYDDLQRYLSDELPTIPIYRPAIVTAVSDKLEGFAIDGKGFYHFDKAWLNS